MALVITSCTGTGLVCQTTTSNLFKQRVVASLPHTESLLISVDHYFKKTLYSSKAVYSDRVRGLCAFMSVCVHVNPHTGMCVCVCLSSIECLQSEGLGAWFQTIPEARLGPSHPTSHLDRDYFPSGSANFLMHPFGCMLTHNQNNKNQG